MKSLIVLSVIVIVLALVVCLVPLREEAHGVMVDYEKPLTKIVALSFGVNDYMRTDTIEEYRKVGSCGCTRKLVEVPVQVACLDIKNIDDIPGQFLVTLSGFEAGSPFSQTVILSLNASEQKTVEYQAEVIDCWDYEVIPNVKKVETGELITAQRQEIRYKRVTVLDYFLHYR